MDQPAKKNLIKVKGKDGTISYLTFEEFKARKAGKVQKKEDVVTEKVPVQEVVVQKEQSKKEIPKESVFQKTELPESVQKKETPIPEIEVKSEKTKSWSADDHDSLLNTEIEDHETHNVSDRDAYDHRRIVDEVMQDLTVPIAPNLQMNARTLIDSYIRGVRDKHHVHELAVRDTVSGGLGLSDADAARIVVLIEDTLEGHHRKLKKVQKAKPKKSITREIDHSAVKKGMELSTTVPVDHVFEDMARAKLASRKKVVEKVQTKKFRPSIPTDVAKKLEAHYEMPAQKSVRTPTKVRNMQDMHAPIVESASMGPVEEMKQFTLVDFRRLSNDPARAVEKFAEKLQGWKEESYLLYMEAREAWFESPLYKEFQDMMISALNEKQSLQEYMREHGQKDQIHLKEFNAMVELSGQLAV